MKIIMILLALWIHTRDVVALAGAKVKKAKYSCEKCNIVFVGIDAVQAAHVGHLGYSKKRNTTPFLDKFAEQGFSFSQAISPASWTVPAYLSVFTSTFPSVHGLVNRFIKFSETEKVLANFKNSSPDIFAISEILKELGYRRGAFTGDAGVSAILGYDKGFETYYDQVRFGGLANSAKLALEWVDSLDKKDPFFLFVHGYDAHGQYEIPVTYQNRFEPKTSSKFKGTIKEQERLRENGLNNKLNDITDQDVQFWRSWYDTKIRDLDDRLESLIEALKKRGLFENTIVVIFADHGTEFYEHERFDHGHSLYDELLRVPMVFFVPNLKGGDIFPEQVSTLDILPTVLDLINCKVKQPLAAQMKGRSLANSFLTKKLNGTDVFSETDYRNYSHKRAVRTHDGWKYILSLETGRAELYNWKKDPGEQKNLIEKEPRQARILRNRLSQHIVTNLNSNTDIKPSQSCLPVYKGQCE